MESDKGRPVPLQKSDLPPMAETLEKYTRELKEQWRPFVSELVRGFDSEILRSKDSENSSKQEQAELQPT
jgi:Sec-independent protein translocase protein TatA